MRRHLVLLPLAIVTGAPSSAAGPVVVELYQSQGCSSCPPADAVLNALAARPDVIALNFAVTYWDQLGWKDSFAKPTFTARQWDYARTGGRSNVSTPQMIVGGRTAIVGSRPGEVDAVIARARGAQTGPAILVNARNIGIPAGKAAAPATLWLVRYDPRTIQVAIRAGENNGRTVPHRNIVRELIALGTWDGGEALRLAARTARHASGAAAPGRPRRPHHRVKAGLMRVCLELAGLTCLSDR